MIKRETILKTLTDLIKSFGRINVTRTMLCGALGISENSFYHFTGTTFTDLISDPALDDVPEPDDVSARVPRARPEPRKRQILECAVELSRVHGYLKVTRDMVAEAAGVSSTLVSKYYKNMPELRNSVLEYAVQKEVLEVIAQGLTFCEPVCTAAPRTLVCKAMNNYK